MKKEHKKNDAVTLSIAFITLASVTITLIVHVNVVLLKYLKQ